MPERRIYARHTPTALTYVSAGAANGGILLNVSEAGCALQLISPPPLLSDVHLELDLGSSLPHVEVAGKVMWADDTGCSGIRFNHLSDAARQTIRRFIEITPADPTMHEIGMNLDPLVARDPEEALFDVLEPQAFESRLQELSTGAAFVAIVEECRSATGATASALAMLKSRDMVCRASCGKGAPPNGVRLDITSERSFTAQCVSTATTLRCVDSQIDPRVNAQVCQRLGIRSVTAMPLMHDGHVVGVLEVFSSDRNAFHDGHIAALENLGRIAVEFAISRHEITLPSAQATPSWSTISRPVTPRTTDHPTMPPTSPGQAVNRSTSAAGSSFTSPTAVAVARAPLKDSITAAAATPVTIQSASPTPTKAAQTTSSSTIAPVLSPASARALAPESQTEARPALSSAPSSASIADPLTPIVRSPMGSSTKNAAATVIEARPAKPSSATTVSKLQPKASRFEIAPLAEEPAAFAGVEYPATAAETLPPLFQEHTLAARSNHKSAIIAGVTVAMLLIGAIVIWQLLRDPSTSPTAQTVSAAASLSAPQPDNTVPATNAAASPVSTPYPIPISSSISKGAGGTSKNPNSKESTSTKSNASDASYKKDNDTVTSDNESSAAPKVIALAHSEGLRSRETPAVAPPTIKTSNSLPALLAGGSTPSLPSLRVAAPPTAPAPTGVLKVSSTAITDHLIRKVDPTYPEIARRSGVSGAVRLRLEVGVDGKVKSATVLDGPGMLATSAKEAVLQWRYRPYVVENKPVPFETEIVVRFTGR